MKPSKMQLLVAAWAFSGVLAVQPAAATLITSLPGGTGIGLYGAGVGAGIPGMPGPGEIDIAPGVTWSSSNPYSVLGYSGIYGFTSNGYWNDMLMSGLNARTGTMTLQFATPVNAVGGFLNYVPTTGNSPTIAVYDAGMNLLDSAALTFDTSGVNSGQFLGFLENNNISFFTLSDAYVAITDLTVSYQVFPGSDQAVPVPEPATLLLVGAGLAGALMRKKSRT